MIAAGDVDDLATRRLELALPAFREWPAPDPDRDDWASWESLLGSTRAPPGEPASAAMRFRTDGYGTVSSALIALPARGADRCPIFRFAEWLPDVGPVARSLQRFRMSGMKARVQIMLKGRVLDPQGIAIGNALVGLGFKGIAEVRQGKVIELELVESDPGRARAEVEAMCRQLLANPVIEDYTIELEPAAADRGS